MTCIKRRMLFACAQSYDPLQPVAEREVDWLDDPEIVERDAPHWRKPIDCALVGRIPEGVLVAFRGTLPPLTRDRHESGSVILDWANNGQFLARRIAPYEGLVHEGFARSIDRLWRDVGGSSGLETRIGALLDDGRGPRALYFTGHSKGGALANLAAFRARSKPDWAGVPIRVFTVAAARAGNGEFRAAYEQAEIDCIRYEAALDAVPFLPFGLDTPAAVKKIIRSLWPDLADGAYEPVGRRVPAKLSWGEWAAGWTRHFASLFKRGGFEAYKPAVIAAHMIAPQSAYDSLICSGEPGCPHN